MSKEHVVTVRIESRSEGTLNNYIEMGEYASTPQELTKKHFSLTQGAISGITEAAVALAVADGNSPS